MKKITIRPSSINSYVGCPRQWYHVNILGKKTIPNARAAMGTGIHKGVEQMWLEAMKEGEKNPNLTMMTQSALEEYDKQEKKADGQLQYDEDYDKNKAQQAIVQGTKAFVDDILPYTDIPKKVETRFNIPLKHKIVKQLRGTVDYISGDTIADIKTSKRKVVPQSYVLQQSLYKLLVEHSGIKVKSNQIQGIILAKTKVAGSIDKLDDNVSQAKFIVNNLLDRLDLLWEGKIDPEILFQGNPKYYLCSDKYCNLRSTCPFVKGR